MKRLLNFLPTHFTLCLMLGIVVQYYFQFWKLNEKYAVLFFSILLIVLWRFQEFKKRQFFTVLSWLLFVFVGFYLVASQDNRTKKGFYGTYKVSDSLVTFKVSKILKSNLYYHKYIGEVVRVGVSESTGEILLNIAKKNAKNSASLNDLFYFKTAIIPIEASKNPFQFDYKAYLAKQGVYHQAFLRNTPYIHKKAIEKTLYTRAAYIRCVIEERLRFNGFKGEELAVIKALVLGQRSTVSKTLLQAYTQAGAIHILAVSGLHVGIVLLILSTLFQPLERLRQGKFIKLFLILVLLWCFAVIAGLSASVVRAVTMFSAVAIAMASKRKALVIHSLITSMFVLLLVKPLFLFDVGFQLSYLAVFSIVTLQPRLSLLWKPKVRIVAFFWQLFTVSMAAQIGVLPLSLFYFHQFPGLFMLSNLIIIPCIGAVLIGGVLCVFLSLFHMLPAAVAALYAFVIRLMNQLVGWLAAQESFLITHISFSWLLLIASYLCVFLAIYLVEKSSFKRWVYFLLAVVWMQCCLLYEKKEVASSSEVVIFNKSRHTLIGENRKGYVQLFHNLDTLDIKSQGVMKDYGIGMKVVDLKFKNEIPNLIQLEQYCLFIVDSLGVYAVDGVERPVVLLRSSPKINLERLIQRMRPKQLIADASNYRSLVLQWKAIATKHNIPFVYTQESGAVVLK